MKFSFSSAVINYDQPVTAVGSCYEKKNKWNFHLHPRVTCVPNFSPPDWFSPSSAVISCHQFWIPILVPMLDCVPSFSLIGWLGCARECDGQHTTRRTNRRQMKIELTQDIYLGIGNSAFSVIAQPIAVCHFTCILCFQATPWMQYPAKH